MNANRHRIVFNRARGLLMAVAEIACAQGKSPANSNGPAPVAPPGFSLARLRPVAFATLLACGAQLALMSTASAQVVAYKAAPASQRPTILQAGNGVPLVNIQTPSAAGVSRNTYEQFDVQMQGVILNNSRTNTSTQLGGWVQGNPWLARGTARVILNEVISANPSQLMGYVEVAGSAAQVVIANPAGVTCNGCGFINASRATLTTGTPIVSSNLDGYRVEGGTIRVEGAGMDASRVGYTDLIARAVEVNAGIWAQTLKVTAGANVVDAGNTQATPIAGTGAAPAFAIDVASLGGMYAGKIVLVGTEAGVGVRNAGYLGASAGEVVVTADGQLTNSGSVIAASKVGVDARAGITNTGTVYAQGDLGFATAGDITNNGGLVAAGNNATLAATGASSRISSDATSVFAAGLNADGSLAAVGKLDLAASEQITTRGQQLAGGDLALSARHLDLADSTNSGRNVSLTASAGDIDLSRASTVASATLATHTTQALIHNDAQSNAQQLDLAAASISNVHGEIIQTGSGDTAIALAGNLDNREGRIASNSANLGLAAQTLNNTDGRIEHAGSGTLTLTADTLAGTRGQIASNGTLALAAQTATLDAGDTVANALDIQADTLSNKDGSLAQTGNGEARINVAGRLDNRGGTLASNGRATLTAGVLDNRSSGQIATAGDQTLSADILVNDGGSVSAGRKLQATIAQGVGNAAGLIAAGTDLSLTAASLDNTGGTIGAVAGSLDANTIGAIANNAGRIEAAHNITLTSAGLTNIDGTVVGNALAIDTRSQALDNARGRLVANATMNLQTGALTNAAGLIQSAAALSIDTHGQAFDNTAAGSISGQAGVMVTTGAFNNAAGFLGAVGTLTVVADTLANTANGLIVSEAEMALNTRQLDNRSGQIQSAGNLAVRATDSADNTGGLLRSGQTLTVDTASLANANTLGADQGIEGNALAISANTIGSALPAVDNRSGALRANTALAINSSGALNNSGGLITSAQHVAIRDAAATKTLAVDNTAGTIAAGEQLDIDAASLSGGQLLSHRDLAIDLGGKLDNTGEITANRNARINVGGTLDNSGTLQAGTTLAVTAGSLDNRASGEILAHDLKLAATDTHTLTNRGLIDGGDTRIDAITLNNLGTGRIYGDHLAIAATTLTNATETVNGATSAPVIAARDRLDLGVGTLNNRSDDILSPALIFSAGDLAIGGALDTNNRATGQAGTINNASGIIEALGDLRIDSSQLNNSRYRFASSQVVTSNTPVNVVLWDNGGGGNYKLTKTTNIQVSETRVTADSGAGKLLAGGDLHLTGTVNNDKSEIMAGGNIQLDMAGYTATSLQGQTQKSETGYTSLYYRKKCKWYEFCSYKNHRTTNSPYNDGPYTLATFDVAVAKMTANQAITGTATQISNLSVGAVNQGAAGANGVTAAVGSGSNVARITQVNTPATAGGPAGVVATVNAPGALPNNSLYHNNPNPTGRYLIETDPRFASYRQWISSDYMLAQLALDPATSQKRLGDGFYEQRLITEQIAQLTGRRFLTGYQDNEAQYLALMNAGITVAQAWNLIPGVALSAEQMAQLTTDMVWLVEKEVTLADGSAQKVLTPQLYARIQPGDLDASGGLLAANSIDLDVSGDLTNMGTLAGRQLVSLTADNIKNLAGRISGEQVALAARTDLNNLGGAIAADQALIASAGRNIRAESLTESHTGGSAHASLQSTAITRLASLHVKNPGGTLQLEAGGDIALLAAHLINTAPTAAGPASRTTLIAGNDIQLATLTESTASGLMLDGNNYRRQSETHETGSAIESSGDIRLQAGQSVSARAASVTSNEGALVVTAGKDIAIEAGEASQRSEAASRTTKSGFLSSKTTTTRDTSSDTTAIASTFSGDSTTLIADRDIAIKGSNVVATNDTTLIATRNLNIEAATETHNETHYSKTKQSGIFSSGGVGFTLGSKQNSTDQKTDATLAARSTVGSTDGNVLLLAGETYKQVGSDVIAAKGDIDIAAKTVDIKEARETSRTITETKSKQSGFTVAFTNPVISAVQTAQQMSDAAKDTSDPRMKALAAASTGLAGYNAYTALEAGQGKTVALADGTVKDNQIPVLNDKGEIAEYRDANAADKMGGVGINLSIGGSKSSSTTTQSSDTAAVSNLTAGRDIRIEASGAGEQSDVTLQGTNATAARNLTLTAEDEIRLLAAKNTADQHSTNKNSSASVGIGFMVGGTQNGFTIQAGVSGGKGKADGQDVSHSNTHVTAGDMLTLQSGGDTTMKGAVAKGEQVKAEIGGDLLIESLQDTSTYDSQQKSLGVSVSLCIPPFCVGATPVSGSVSASNSKVQSDYASVTEQSAIRAGDKGFHVDVNGDTDLKGGAITSTQKAIDDQRNQFKTDGELTLSDIENKAEYKAKSASVNVGTGFSAAGKLMPGGTSAGFGKDGDKAESMTLAAISDIAGNTAARTGDAETGIAKIFDQEKVQKEIDAQTRITQMFGQLASKAVGDYAETKLKEAQTLRAQGREQEAKDLESQWSANGTLRLAAHTVVGGLTGGVSGAAGAAVGTLTAPAVAEALAEAGIDANLGKVITALASTAAGAAVGGTAGATTALNEVANNYLDHRKPNAATLSEKERYERAAEECRSGNDSACTAQREMAAQSIRRDQLLADACKVDQLQCNALTREAIAMGNLVYGRFGELVWANSPDKTFPLNVATIGPAQSSPVYASAWHYQQAGNLAEGVALAAPGAAGARVIGGMSALGFGLGAGFDAVGQYAQNGSVRLEQSGVAGITGAIGLPVAARGGVYLVPLTGATVAAANTTFNNWYYNEATNIWVAAGLGAGFAAAAPYVGQAVTGGTNRLLGNPMMHIPASGPVQPMQIYRNAEFWAAVPRQAGTAASHTVGSLPSFIPLDNGKSGIRP